MCLVLPGAIESCRPPVSRRPLVELYQVQWMLVQVCQSCGSQSCGRGGHTLYARATAQHDIILAAQHPTGGIVQFAT